MESDIVDGDCKGDKYILILVNNVLTSTEFRTTINTNETSTPETLSNSMLNGTVCCKAK
jgi:hypothetical protein